MKRPFPNKNRRAEWICPKRFFYASASAIFEDSSAHYATAEKLQNEKTALLAVFFYGAVRRTPILQLMLCDPR
jgi:hypothetical protein